jgi:hypothetical protein
MDKAWRGLWLGVLGLGSWGCTDKGDDSGVGEADADTDADSDTDTDTDTDTDIPTNPDCPGKPVGNAQLSLLGSGSVVPGVSYDGTESYELFAVDGPSKGNVVCRITWDVDSTGIRKDCYGDPVFNCDPKAGGWAFDLMASNAVIDPKAAACDAVLCGADLASLEGPTTLAYGPYVEHAFILARYDDEKPGWSGVGYGSWSEKKHTLTYELEIDERPYFE